MIARVCVFPNGMVMVFDQEGQQLPEFQGPRDDVEYVIRLVAPEVIWEEAIWR